MKPEKTFTDLFSAEAEAASEARADADIKAGRVVDHDRVRHWLASWGSENPLPRPRSGD